MRPTFTRLLPGDPEAFCKVMLAALGEAHAHCRGQFFGTPEQGGAILRRLERDQHFWSPALHLYVAQEPSGRWILHGRFSPSSPVWTGFIAIYLTLACIGIAAGCYGGAQMIMDKDPWAFIGMPIALALAAFTYGAAFIGQGLGSDDMYELRRFVDEAIDVLEESPELASMAAKHGAAKLGAVRGDAAT